MLESSRLIGLPLLLQQLQLEKRWGTKQLSCDRLLSKYVTVPVQ